MSDNQKSLFCAYSGQPLTGKWIKKEDIFDHDGTHHAMVRWAGRRYRWDKTRQTLVSRLTNEPVKMHPNALMQSDDADAIQENDDAVFIAERAAHKTPRKKAAKKAGPAPVKEVDQIIATGMSSNLPTGLEPIEGLKPEDLEALRDGEAPIEIEADDDEEAIVPVDVDDDDVIDDDDELLD